MAKSSNWRGAIILQSSVDQAFAIAVTALDRAVRPIDNLPALLLQPRAERILGIADGFGIGDDPALADMRPADLELRLEEADQIGAWRGQ